MYHMRANWDDYDVGYEFGDDILKDSEPESIRGQRIFAIILACFFCFAANTYTCILHYFHINTLLLMRYYSAHTPF